MKLRAGQEITVGLLSQNKKHIVVTQRNGSTTWNVIFIIGKAGSVGEQMMQANRFAVCREFGEKFRQTISQRKFSPRDQN